MKSFVTTVLLSLCAATAFAVASPSLVPQPQAMEVKEGGFQLNKKTVIIANPAAQTEAEKLAAALRPATGFKLAVSDKPSSKSVFRLELDAALKDQLGAEGYQLSVKPESITIRAATEAGLFYGGVTLRQLLPPAICSSKKVSGVQWEIPCVEITDSPRFAWRGLMLDVSRHFYTKEEVEKVLDVMALHKMNSFHWHLVDDQGWRIEIKKYPKLTQVGAWREGIGFGLNPTNTTRYGKDGRYGGYYTQDDIREVVTYAAKLHINVVPEIEMPGHASAALLAYPQFLCPGVKLDRMPDKGGVFDGIYCAGNDATFDFLQDILAEVAGLFPGKFIHIGGDEVPKDNWRKCDHCQARIKAEGLKNEEELQSYFTRRIEKIVNAHGKTLIGWSEILQGGLAQNAAVMDWIGGAREAASAGHDVVMTPIKFCYFDHYQSTNHANEPFGIGGYLPLVEVYSFEPLPANLAPEFQKHILGGQANLWTEYIPNLQLAEYMFFPRLAALAEVTWSPKAARNFDDFYRRLPANNQRLEKLGVNYRREQGQTPEHMPAD